MEDPESYCSNGIELLKGGKFQESAEAFSKAVELDPSRPDYHYRLSKALTKLERYDEAFREANLSVTLDSRNADYNYQRTSIMVSMSDFKGALADCERNMTLFPDVVGYHYLKANALIGLNKTDEAKDELNKTIAEDGDHKHKGAAYYLLGDYQNALEEYQEDLNENKHDPDRYRNVGLIFLNLGKGSEALEELDRSIELKPESSYSHFLKSSALDLLGRQEESLAEIESAISLAPHNPVYRKEHSEMLLKSGHLEEALAEIDMSISLDPRAAECYSLKGTVLVDLGRNSEAAEMFKKAISLDPHSSKYHIQEACALRDTKSYDEALEEFDLAISKDNDVAEFHNEKGITLNVMGRHEDAISEFNKAIELNQNDSGFHYNKTVALHSAGRLKEAFEEIDATISLAPDVVLYQEERAKLLEESNGSSPDNKPNKGSELICRNCGKELVSEDAKFCPFCGCENPLAPEERRVICSNCGYVLTATDAVFCPKCGSKVVGSSSSKSGNTTETGNSIQDSDKLISGQQGGRTYDIREIPNIQAFVSEFSRTANLTFTDASMPGNSGVGAFYKDNTWCFMDSAHVMSIAPSEAMKLNYDYARISLNDVRRFRKGSAEYVNAGASYVDARYFDGYVNALKTAYPHFDTSSVFIIVHKSESHPVAIISDILSCYIAPLNPSTLGNVEKTAGPGKEVAVNANNFCSNCGSKLAPGSAFCNECGKPVSSGASFQRSMQNLTTGVSKLAGKGLDFVKGSQGKLNSILFKKRNQKK